MPGLMPDALAWGVVALTGVTLGALILLAAHRMHLMLLARRTPPPAQPPWDDVLPTVTVQIPVYNEAAVVERALDAAARLDYPRDRLQIQLLDDSTDETRARAERRVARWREAGVPIEVLHRDDRTGYKAGALQEGLIRATGEFVLVLDADFVPPPELIRRLLPPFRDPGVGMVQATWDHLNEDANLLTRCQALLLDAHFFFEQWGRHAAGRFMNFNGTAGMWRRAALDDAGGWSWDTLTEDLDISYRAQMAGWRFVILPRVGVPSEIPEDVRALEVQQKRWAQGGVQTGRKILPTLLRGRWSWRIKLEGVVHLMAHVAHPLTLLLGLLLLPSAVARRLLGLEGLLVLDLAVFACATLSFLLFYTAAGRQRGRPLGELVPRSLAALTLGIGLTAPVSRAVLRGLVGRREDVFRRTPKRGDGPPRYRAPAGPGDRALKAGMALWMVASAAAAVAWGYLPTLPFLLLFAAGYLWLLLADLLGELPAGIPRGIETSRTGSASLQPVHTGTAPDGPVPG